jgi:hypothetical protein
VTPVLSGHVLSETAGARDRPFRSTSSLISFLWSGFAGVVIRGRHRRGNNRILDSRGASPVWFLRFWSIPLSGAVFRSGDRHSVATARGGFLAQLVDRCSPRATDLNSLKSVPVQGDTPWTERKRNNASLP